MIRARYAVSILFNLIIFQFVLANCSNLMGSDCDKGYWAKTVFILDEQNSYKTSDIEPLDWNIFDISSFTVCKNEMISISNPNQLLNGYHVSHLFKGKDGKRMKSKLRKIPLKNLAFPENPFPATVDFFTGKWQNLNHDNDLKFHYEIRGNKVLSFIDSNCEVVDDGLQCLDNVLKGTILTADLKYKEKKFIGTFTEIESKGKSQNLPITFINSKIEFFRCGVEYICTNYGSILNKL